MTDAVPRAADAAAIAQRIHENLERVIVGKHEVLELALVPLLAGGHLLIEDVPGVGKTTLARALARSINGHFSRVQFTADLLPMDLTGSSIFNQKLQDFEFKPGPVFTNILLADELNRATPRTQSALLECMAESQVSVDGTTYPLESVFCVVATLNPVEHAGTFELPETQLDRFMLRISVGYPELEDELRIFDMQLAAHPLDALQSVVGLDEIRQLRALVRGIHVEDSVRRYATTLVRATRDHPEIQLGASPRGTLSLLRAAQAVAFLDGEAFVSPGRIKRVATAVLAHRLLIRPEAALRGTTAADLVDELLDRVAVPIGADAGR